VGHVRQLEAGGILSKFRAREGSKCGDFSGGWDYSKTGDHSNGGWPDCRVVPAPRVVLQSLAIHRPRCIDSASCTVSFSRAGGELSNIR